MASYDWVKGTGILTKVLGGKATLGVIAGTKYPALFSAVPGEWIGIAMGLALIGIAFVLPGSLRGHANARETTGKQMGS